MRLIPSLLFTVSIILNSAQAQDCGCETTGNESFVGMPDGSGITQEQLYPYDQQDPWLHGQYQRVPSFGGYNSFRPHNYRHVMPQGQIAANWGATQGLSYSQQFFNRHRGNFLNGNLHSQHTQQTPPAYFVLSSPTATASPRNFRPASVSRQSPQYQNIAVQRSQQQRR